MDYFYFDTFIALQTIEIYDFKGQQENNRDCIADVFLPFDLDLHVKHQLSFPEIRRE